MIIRDAETRDEAAWRDLWAQYLAFYRVELAEEITAFTWARLMDPASALKARLALAGTAGGTGEGPVIGFAIHLHHPSTWAMGEDCYLEDLYVTGSARGMGAGRALIEDLRRLAAARGWQRLYWHTDQNNARARALYDSIVPSDGHVRYRLRVAG